MFVYGFVTSIRNLFFDKGIFHQKKVDAKVISIGNLTVGGSGKTPLVIYVTNLLKEKFSTKGGLISWFGIVFLAGFTPLPYKIFTITSGFIHFNILF